MPLRTFEFVDVRDWCRPAKTPAQVIELQRTWWPLLETVRAAPVRPDWYVSDSVDESLSKSALAVETMPAARDSVLSPAFISLGVVMSPHSFPMSGISKPPE